MECPSRIYCLILLENIFIILEMMNLCPQAVAITKVIKTVILIDVTIKIAILCPICLPDRLQDWRVVRLHEITILIVGSQDWAITRNLGCTRLLFIFCIWRPNRCISLSVQKKPLPLFLFLVFCFVSHLFSHYGSSIILYDFYHQFSSAASTFVSDLCLHSQHFFNVDSSRFVLVGVGCLDEVP